MYSLLKKDSLRRLMLATTSLLAMACTNPAPKQNMAENTPKKDTIEQVSVTVTDPIINVNFRNDTLSQPVSTLLYYLDNSITRNYYEKKASYNIQLPYFAHEHKHDNNEKVDNETKSYRLKYMYSPSQYAVLCMCDEISANLVAIETAAFEYLAAKNKNKVIEKYEKTYMKFYFEAIKNGEIQPLEFADSSQVSQQELDNYRRFVVNGTQNMWDRIYRKHYSPMQVNMVLNYINNVGLYKPYKANFDHVAKHMFTIGGVDFSKYLDGYLEPYDSRIKLFDQMAYVSSFTKDRKSSAFLVKDVANNYNKLDFNDEELKSALQHMFVASKIKYELNDFSAKELMKKPAIINKAYYKVLYELSHDVSFQSFINDVNIAQKFYLHSPKDYTSFSLLPHYSKDYSDKIKRFYDFKGTNLADLIPSFDSNLLPSSIDVFFSSHKQNYIYTPMIFADNLTDTAINSEEKSSAITESTTTSHSKRVPAKRNYTKKRLSDEMYMPVIDFTQPILVSGALTEDSKNKIVQMFTQFEKIPTPFKVCDTIAQKQYIEEFGDPHYFEDRNYPLIPIKQKEQKHFYITNDKAVFYRKQKNRD